MNIGRRAFVGASAGLLIVKPQTAFGSQANSTVEFGLIGCGGRGNWITPFFLEYAGARVVAVADVQKQALDATRDKFKVDSTRAHYGPMAYLEVAQSKLDAVVIETPPYYHPEQARAAVEAGRHVYCAKPVAIDVPGCKSILDSGRRAAGKDLSFWVDFQSRAQPVFQEAARRVHQGDIGKPVMGQTFYYASRPARDKGSPSGDPGQQRIRNFYMDKVLGGDIIVEQNIHVLDMTNWFLNARPLKAHGTGGRTNWKGTAYDAGDAFDHFVVTYWYPGDVSVSFSSHQLTGAYSDLCVRVFGINGLLDAHYGGSVRIAGAKAWMGSEKDDTFRAGAIENVKQFIAAVREGKPINNAEVATDSNLTAIMGRTAAYTESLVTWDDVLRSTEKWEANLKLAW